MLGIPQSVTLESRPIHQCACTSLGTPWSLQTAMSRTGSNYQQTNTRYEILSLQPLSTELNFTHQWVSNSPETPLGLLSSHIMTQPHLPVAGILPTRQGLQTHWTRCQPYLQTTPSCQPTTTERLEQPIEGASLEWKAWMTREGEMLGHIGHLQKVTSPRSVNITSLLNNRNKNSKLGQMRQEE